MNGAKHSSWFLSAAGVVLIAAAAYLHPDGVAIVLSENSFDRYTYALYFGMIYLCFGTVLAALRLDTTRRALLVSIATLVGLYGFSTVTLGLSWFVLEPVARRPFSIATVLSSRVDFILTLAPVAFALPIGVASHDGEYDLLFALVVSAALLFLAGVTLFMPAASEFVGLLYLLFALLGVVELLLGYLMVLAVRMHLV